MAGLPIFESRTYEQTDNMALKRRYAMPQVITKDGGDGYFSAGPEGGTPKEFIIGSSREGALVNYATWLLGQVRAGRLKYEYARRHKGAAWPACPVCGRAYAIFGQNLGDSPVPGAVQYEEASDEDVLAWAEEANAAGENYVTCTECYELEETKGDA